MPNTSKGRAPDAPNPNRPIRSCSCEDLDLRRQLVSETVCGPDEKLERKGPVVEVHSVRRGTALRDLAWRWRVSSYRPVAAFAVFGFCSGSVFTTSAIWVMEAVNAASSCSAVDGAAALKPTLKNQV